MLNVREFDPCSQAGAERIARTVRAYWEEKGEKVEVWTEESMFGMHVVRSNLKRGNPQPNNPPKHSPWDFKQAFTHPQRR
jgi:hypothetical protein